MFKHLNERGGYRSPQCFSATEALKYFTYTSVEGHKWLVCGIPQKVLQVIWGQKYILCGNRRDKKENGPEWIKIIDSDGMCALKPYGIIIYKA